MARPQKIKLDYFPLDCGFFQDERIIALRREHGALGIVTYIFLLAKVYDNGYYLKIPNIESFAQTIAENITSNREPTAKVAAHVVKAIRYGADIGLIDKYYLAKNCITGVKIQEQYVKSKERYGGRALVKEFSLLGDGQSFPVVSEEKTAVSVTETPISVTETPIKVTEMQQSKIKKNKINNISQGACAREDEFERKFQEFCIKWEIDCGNYYSPLIAELDFDKLDKAYTESPQYLQDKNAAPWAHTLAGLVKKREQISAGEYKKKNYVKKHGQGVIDRWQDLHDKYAAVENQDDN